LSCRFFSNVFWLYNFESLTNLWNSAQNMLKSLNDSTCLRRLYAFKTLIRRLKSSKIWYKSSKIFFEVLYDLIEFLKNRAVKCFMTSSSILVRTYVFLCTSIENQFAFFFNLFRMTLVSSPQLVTRNVVTVNYVDAWVRWWMIFIRWLHNVLYRWFSTSSHVKYPAHMLDTRFVT
jgi:hypothetical protein